MTVPAGSASPDRLSALEARGDALSGRDSATPDLRVMEIPANRKGLGAGTWLHWDELRAWLVAHDARALADEIDETITRGEDVSRRAVTLR